MKTALLLSGGVDSSAVLVERRGEIDVCVFVDYRQPARGRECRCAEVVSALCKVPLCVIDAPLPCRQLSSGGAGVVPHRNLHLLLQAAAHTEADRIYLGATAGDQRDYMDCRQPFFDAAAAALGVEVVAPALKWSRDKCIATCRDAGLLPFTWSCYEAGPMPCKKCASCLQDQA